MAIVMIAVKTITIIHYPKTELKQLKKSLLAMTPGSYVGKAAELARRV